MRILFRIALALALVAFATAAFAGETGSISGIVKDGTGQPVPGATVKITGAQAPSNTVTGAAGTYRFPVVLPGAWTVTADLKGLGAASQKVQVFVDNDVQVNLVLVQTAKAEIVVTGAVAEIDKKASEVNFNYTDNVIKDLPLTRSYEGLIKLVPGTPGTDGSGLVTISGGTRQDNKYLLDGVNITNPGYGSLGVDTNQLDIADFNVKKGGITAEFGRTSGAMFNAVTRSGSNDWNGSILGNFSPSSFQAEKKYATTRETTNYNGQGNFGFPIVKDTLFGYASAAYYYTKNAGQSATSNNVTSVQPDSHVKNGDYFGKLTGFIGQPLLVNAGFRIMPTKSDNQFDNSYDFPTAGYKNDATNYVGNVTVDWFASKDTVVEAKYVYLDETDAVEAQNPLTSRPNTIDPANLGAYGQWNNPARNSGNQGVYPYITTGDTYKRNEVKATLSQYLDIGPTQNQFKLGGGYETLEYDHARVSNGWGTFLVNSSCPKGVCNPNAAVPGMIRARFYGTQPNQIGRARTYSAFIQDTITWKNVTLYLGVLANKDDFAQICEEGGLCGTTVNATTTRYNFMTFRWSDEIQPRFGITWNTNLIQGDKLYSTYGEYANLDQKSSSRAYAPYRIRYDQAWFDKTTGAFLGQQILGSSGSKVIPTDLKAPYYQEWIIGYSAAFAKDFSFDVYYQYRNLKNPFEDVPINPADYFGSFQAKNIDGARRVYRAVTLDVQKRYANGWYADANITISKLYGNFDNDYMDLQFNTSSLLEDDPTLNSSVPNRYGRFGQDRPVIAKLMGSYDFPFGLTFGGFLRVQSGTAWEPRGAGPNSTSSRYLLPAATYRLPTWTTFDLLGAYTFKLNPSMGVRIEARVSNLFNTQTVMGVSQIQYLDGYKDGVPASTMGPQGTTQPNPNYGNASSWASPRRLVLTARLDF